MHNGLKIELGIYHGAWMTEIIRNLRGCHQPQEERVFYRVLPEMPPHACILEIGAGWGYYSMWFSKSVSNADCHLIEPSAGKLAIGKRCFALNKLNATFTRAFAGKESDPHAFFTDWDGKRYPALEISVDDYAERHRIPFVHILHSDIQGAEYDMLLGSQRCIEQGRIGYFFISTHSQPVHDACLAFLKSRRFHIVAAHTPAESYSEDGLLVARSMTMPGIRRVRISKRRPSLFGRLRRITDRLSKNLLKSARWELTRETADG